MTLDKSRIEDDLPLCDKVSIYVPDMQNDWQAQQNIIFMFILFTQPLRSGRIWHKVNF